MAASDDSGCPLQARLRSPKWGCRHVGAALCAPSAGGDGSLRGSRGALASFLAETDARDEGGRGLPRFVVDEVEAFLKCGILAHGFIRVACDTCRENRVVAFACKRRGFCPSCLGRRMCDFAAHLRDHVMPHVPVRQWVLTVPVGLRATRPWTAAASPSHQGSVIP